MRDGSPWRRMAMRLACVVASAGGVHADELPSEAPRSIEPLFAPRAAHALHRIAVPFSLDGKVDEWPKDRTLTDLQSPKAMGWDAQQLRVAQVPDGVAVAITRFPTSRAVVRLHVASLAQLDLPRIAWMWRWSAAVSYDSIDGCDTMPDPSLDYDRAACRAWYSQQVEYRRELKQEFVRSFEIDPKGEVRAVVVSGTPRFPLKTDVMPRVAIGIEDGRGFARAEILLPWDALPSTDSLVFASLYLRVELCSLTIDGGALGECREIADPAQPGVALAPPPPDSAWTPFHRLDLAEPRRYRVTPCAYPLLGDRRPGFGSPQRGYFLPGADLDIDTIASLHVPAAGYLDSPWGVSPTPVITHFGAVALASDEHVCFPSLRWAKGELSLQSDLAWLEPEQENAALRYRVLPLDDDTALIVFDPMVNQSRSSEGQCGACPWHSMAIWHLDRRVPSLTTAWVFDERQDDDEMPPPRFDLSDDGRTLHLTTVACRYDTSPASTAGTAQRPLELVRHCREREQVWCLARGDHTFLACGDVEHELIDSREE